MSKLQRTAPAPPKDWEDEYHKLNAKHSELKGIYNEMEEHNRKLQGRIRKLESDLTQLGGGGPAVPQSREDEQLVVKLYAENSKLKASNTSLKEKNKLMLDALEKKKRELTLANKKNMSLKSASVGELPAAKGASIAQDIDIKPAPTNKKLGGSVKSSSVSSHAAAIVSESLPQNADNGKLIEICRNYKVRWVSYHWWPQRKLPLSSGFFVSTAPPFSRYLYLPPLTHNPQNQ